jgi:gas vesicle protein
MNNRNKTLAIGAFLGAVTGALAALMLYRRAEKEGAELSISTGEGLKIGLLVFGLLRSISTLDDR